MLANRTIQAAAGGTIYQILKSLRFRSAASAYLSRSVTSSSADQRRNTVSLWFKRGRLGTAQVLYQCGPDGGNYTSISITTNDQIQLYSILGSTGRIDTTWAPVLRDPSAWYHLVVSIDTTQAVASNRAIAYINGVAYPAVAPPAQNDYIPITYWSGTWNSRIGSISYSVSNLFDGYLTEINLIEGQQLASTSFGQIDPNTGVWSAKKYSGTYGTNGFYLDFNDSSSLTSASNVGLGKDLSGNANYWVTNNISIATANIVESFTTTGTTSWTAPLGITSVEYLVVGGGGGANWGAGGGGGFRTGTLSVTPGNSYTVTVGVGGSGAGVNGGDSIFSSITSIGGGAGPNAAGNGTSGGSGGGGGTNNGLGGAGTAGQGFAGGRGFTDGATYTSSGGGGGASQAGSDGGNPGAGGKGGDGISSSISGSPVTYAGGGGGYGDTYGSGANGAGGGSTPNRGGGGSAGAGGSGIVILSYGTTTQASYDSMLDVPLGGGGSERGNYCVLNFLDKNSNFTLNNGNLNAYSDNTANWRSMASTFGNMITGKWYYEVKAETLGSSVYISAGWELSSLDHTTQTNGVGGSSTSNSFGILISTTLRQTKVNLTGFSSDTNTNATGDILMVAVDFDNGKGWVGKNGVWYDGGNPGAGTSPCTTTISGGMTPVFQAYQGGNLSVNFGQRAFAYTLPTGFKALHTGNLTAPTIKKPNQYFDTTLYTGDGTSTKTISGVNFQSDFIWIKTRSSATNHQLQDSVRGFNLALASSTTGAEGDNGTLGVKNVTPTSFDVGAGSAYNVNAATYVAWQWKKGSIPGIDVIAGSTSASPVAHTLGVKPAMMIVKSRVASTNWQVAHKSLAASINDNYIMLNTTGGTVNSVGIWGGEPTSSQFYVAAGINLSGSYIAYLFAEVVGFSKFGSYTGNGSVDGPFIYCGFRPKYIMTKRTDTISEWVIIDSVRDSYNVSVRRVYPNLSNAEDSGDTPFDMLSNGFKLRTTNPTENTSGGTYIFMAFAEVPFKSGLAR